MTEFQEGVNKWMVACFGPESPILTDVPERTHRFLEESLELVQAMGCSKEHVYELVEYVFNRPVGKPHNEVGGVLVTLSALSTAATLTMKYCGDAELHRIWQNIDRIREKCLSKPANSPLPGKYKDNGTENTN